MRLLCCPKRGEEAAPGSRAVPEHRRLAELAEEGPHVDVKTAVVALFQDAGFATIDLGNLPTGGALQQIHHPLAGVNLIQL
jgi:predicted dinucleotide-binding enzyme